METADRPRAITPLTRATDDSSTANDADDFVIGIIGSLEEAKQIMDEVKGHLRCHLHLNVAEAKSRIHHAKAGVTFLGYEVRVCTRDRIRWVSMGRRHPTLAVQPAPA